MAELDARVEEDLIILGFRFMRFQLINFYRVAFPFVPLNFNLKNRNVIISLGSEVPNGWLFREFYRVSREPITYRYVD